MTPLNFWPFRRKPKPECTVILSESIMDDSRIAAAWALYGGVLFMVHNGEYFKLHPDRIGYDSPFDAECYARDSLAEAWEKMRSDGLSIDLYLNLMVEVRTAGFIREYVWCYLRRPTWRTPLWLELAAFEKWAAGRGLSNHQAVTLAMLVIH